MSGCDPQHTQGTRTSESAATIKSSVLAGPFIGSCRTCRKAATRATPGPGRPGATDPYKLRSEAFAPGTVFKRYGPLSFPLQEAMVNPGGMAFVACEPGTLLVEILTPPFSAPPVEAFVEAVQSLELCGIVGLKKMKDGVLLTYDERSMRVQDLRALLAAAYSKVTYDAGDYCPRTHSLPITFGGPAGPDLAVACVLFDTTERTLIRRLCRSKRTIKMFAAPGASALLEIPWSDDGLQAFQASRSKRAAPPGSLLLSGAGLTITSRECYSDECLIGRVSYGAGSAIDAFQLGDSVWLRGQPCQQDQS